MIEEQRQKELAELDAPVGGEQWLQHWDTVGTDAVYLVGDIADQRQPGLGVYAVDMLDPGDLALVRCRIAAPRGAETQKISLWHSLGFTK